jgi:hypothetical protein
LRGRVECGVVGFADAWLFHAYLFCLIDTKAAIIGT